VFVFLFDLLTILSPPYYERPERQDTEAGSSWTGSFPQDAPHASRTCSHVLVPARDGRSSRSGLPHRNPPSVILSCARSRCPPVPGRAVCTVKIPRAIVPLLAREEAKRIPPEPRPEPAVLQLGFELLRALSAFLVAPDGDADSADQPPAEDHEGDLPLLRRELTASLLGVCCCIVIERGNRDWGLLPTWQARFQARQRRRSGFRPSHQ
jgi:hypothetical protein